MSTMRICLVAMALLQGSAKAYFVKHPDGSITRVRQSDKIELEPVAPEKGREPRFLSQFKSQEQLKAVQDAHESFVNNPYGTLGMGSGVYFQGMTKRDQYSTSANYMDNKYFARKSDNVAPKLDTVQPEPASPETGPEPRFLSNFKSQEQLNVVQDAHEAFVNSPYGTLGKGSGAYFQGMTKRDQHSTSANYMDTQRSDGFDYGSMDDHLESQRTQHSRDYGPAQHQRQQNFINNPWGTTMPQYDFNEIQKAPFMDDDPNNGPPILQQDVDFINDAYGNKQGPAYHGLQPPISKKKQVMPELQNGGFVGDPYGRNQGPPYMIEDPMYGPTKAQQLGDFINDPYGSKQGPAYHGLYQPRPPQKPVVSEAQNRDFVDDLSQKSKGPEYEGLKASKQERKPVMPEPSANVQGPYFRQHGPAEGQVKGEPEAKAKRIAKEEAEQKSGSVERTLTSDVVHPIKGSRPPANPKIRREYTAPKVTEQTTVNAKESVGVQQKMAQDRPRFPAIPQTTVKAKESVGGHQKMAEDGASPNAGSMNSDDSKGDGLMQAYYNEMMPSA